MYPDASCRTEAVSVCREEANMVAEVEEMTDRSRNAAENCRTEYLPKR
jgi:hypothetical protein